MMPIGAALLAAAGHLEADQGHHHPDARESLSHGSRNRYRMADAAAVRLARRCCWRSACRWRSAPAASRRSSCSCSAIRAILNMMPSRIFPFMTDYQLSAVPLFIFMAAMLEKAGIIEELFDAVYKWLGSVKGGLAVGDGAGLHGARGDGRRRRRDRSHHGHDRAAGDAQARLRPEARLRLAARRRHARNPDPAVGHGDRLRGGRAAVARRAAGRLDLPGLAAVRALHRLHH